VMAGGSQPQVLLRTALLLPADGGHGGRGQPQVLLRIEFTSPRLRRVGDAVTLNRM
jgi:hypothetical protein